MPQPKALVLLLKTDLGGWGQSCRPADERFVPHFSMTARLTYLVGLSGGLPSSIHSRRISMWLWRARVC